MSVGDKIKQIRKEHRLSQEQIGEICGVTKGMVSQWENGLATPPIDRMLLLRERYHIDLNWLYCDDGKYRPELGALLAVAEKLPSYAVHQLTKEGTSFVELIEAGKQQKPNGTK